MINPIKIFVEKVYINIKLLLLIIFVLKAIENTGHVVVRQMRDSPEYRYSPAPYS